ncbi:type II toxin-antitoxin system VapC family toxin [Nostoc sp.]|uniref:type II toxin-antitoxin system VapC family toxin n=1 Tax=Nostoc sp. TaxID=1180 RepID=UPI002FFAB32A
MKYVIDTHTLIWFLEGNSRLGANANAILSNPDSQLVIPATTLAEAVWIVERYLRYLYLPSPRQFYQFLLRRQQQQQITQAR